jgi:hypothetical protein
MNRLVYFLLGAKSERKEEKVHAHTWILHHFFQLPLPWAQGKSPLSIFLSVVQATWAKVVAWQVLDRIFGFHWNTVRKAVRDLDEAISF